MTDRSQSCRAPKRMDAGRNSLRRGYCIKQPHNRRGYLQSKRGEDVRGEDRLEELREWVEHRYDLGHYTGGRLHPLLTGAASEQVWLRPAILGANDDPVYPSFARPHPLLVFFDSPVGPSVVGDCGRSKIDQETRSAI